MESSRNWSFCLAFPSFFQGKPLYLKFHAQKSLLFHSNQPWIKRDSETFDVTMGAYDGTEICELVGIFMVSLLSKRYSSNNIGLYRLNK